MKYIVRVNEKFVAAHGLVSRRSMATKFVSRADAVGAGCAATCEPYFGDHERIVAWSRAKEEKRFEIIDALTLEVV